MERGYKDCAFLSLLDVESDNLDFQYSNLKAEFFTFKSPPIEK